MKVFIRNGHRTCTRREPIAETCSNYDTKLTCVAADRGIAVGGQLQAQIKANAEGVGYGA